MEPILLSVITVCYQAKDALARTADSLAAQSFRQFEYVVVDGGSRDGTCDYLQSAQERFASLGISLRFLSEPDHGIYDAMNKGARLAAGRWLLFLNAGDLLASSGLLEQFFSDPAAIPAHCRILYGDTLCSYQGQVRRYPALPLEHLTYEMAFCHQSVFIDRALMLAHPYDTSYRVCADHHFFLRAYREGVRFDYRPVPVSVYEIAGYSDRNKLLAHREQRRMQRELGVFRLSPAWLCRELCFYAKFAVKSLFGQGLVDRVRRRRLR